MHISSAVPRTQVHTVHQCPLHWNFINRYNYLVSLTTATLLCWLLQLSAEPHKVTIFWTTESQTWHRVWHSPRTDPPSSVHISTDANQFFIMTSTIDRNWQGKNRNRSLLTQSFSYPGIQMRLTIHEGSWTFLAYTAHQSLLPLQFSLSFTRSYNKTLHFSSKQFLPI